MKRKIAVATGIAVAATLALAACSSSGNDTHPSQSSGPVTITVSGWSLATTPEFQTLADGFHEKNPNVTVKVQEYDAANYSTLITADLAAGSAPDIITQKEVKAVPAFVGGGQLLDVSDVKLPKGINGVSSYKVDGKTYAVPYRIDSWVLYYDKDLFDKAGVDYPDGTWTWDDYADAATKLQSGLKTAGVAATGTYQHSWQSAIQGFANSQAPKGGILTGKYDYYKSYYNRVLELQSAGAQVPFNDISANKLTYQAEFGKQAVGMMPMGTWYIATLISQQASGDANAFKWGIAPIPQYDSSTTGKSKVPVTFGDPTGFGINAAIDKSKVQAAKDFLAYAAGAEGAKSLAAIGITPALTNADVASTFFSTAGAPTDALSKFAWSTHLTKPENPTSDKTAAIQSILNDLNTAVMSGSTSVSAAITNAEQQVQTQVGP
jgi:multiple sugar transport system substrate-binding protein